MGQYKVPLNVEAEDKILGYLTFKQLLYVTIGLMWAFLTFSIFRAVPIIFIIVGIPPSGLFLMLGLIQREGQPFETYFLALLGFLAKSKRRIWVKDEVGDLFRIEKPKPKTPSVNRDPNQIRGQLENLSRVLDSRGWVIHQPNVEYDEMAPAIDLKDRLFAPQAPKHDPLQGAGDMADILDMNNNPIAQSLSYLMEDSKKIARENAIQKMRVPNIEDQSTSKMTGPSPADILKLANSDLKVSQVATRVKRLLS